MKTKVYAYRSTGFVHMPGLEPGNYEQRQLRNDSDEYSLNKEKEVYMQIEKGEPLCLDYCYLDNLSLSSYKEDHELAKKQHVSLRDFSARQAFFDSKHPIDLSYAD